MQPRFDSLTTMDSPIGPITLFALGEKLVAIEIGRKLKSQGSAKVLATARKQLEQYFAGSPKRFDIPISLSGTDFQLKVWKELSKIPCGKQTSYQQIASRIGKPRAARAVGGAVGANPLPLVIGCHRVLGSSGKLTGYSGGKGLKTKIWLLDHEGIEYRG